MSKKSKRTRGVGHPANSKTPLLEPEVEMLEPDLTELYADQEFEERHVPASFDRWTNGDFVPEVDILLDEDVLPCDKVLFMTEEGFVRVIDSEGNYETYDPYLPENAWVLAEILGESSYFDDEDE